MQGAQATADPLSALGGLLPNLDQAALADPAVLQALTQLASALSASKQPAPPVTQAPAQAPTVTTASAPTAVMEPETPQAAAPAAVVGRPRQKSRRTKAQAQAQASVVAAKSENAIVPVSLDDQGNALALAEHYTDRFRYIPGIGWYRWQGHRWTYDNEALTVQHAVMQLADNLATTDPGRQHTDTVLWRHRTRTRSLSGRNATIAMAQSLPSFILHADGLDADPYSLCTPGGIVDLRTGEVSPPHPEKAHSRSTTLAPDPEMATPLWHRYLTDTFGDDPEGHAMIDYIQLMAGYSITGDVGGHVLPFLYGAGQNGKSVLLDLLLLLLGDYAHAAPRGFLMAQNYSSHPTELTDLHGRRIVMCNEVGPNDKFDTGKIQELTGNNRITARRMRQDNYTFNPTHHLWLIGNHKPLVDSAKHAFWRRLRLVPFQRAVPEHAKIQNLSDRLCDEEGPGILAWLIQGSRRYLAGERDLGGPGRVRTATRAYATEEDTIGRFLDEMCVLRPGDPSIRCEQAQLYAAYEQWCLAESVRPTSSRAFAARIRETVNIASPAQMLRSNARKFYPGICLTTSEEEEK
jgi:putative DNA primase/helicase